MANFSAFLPVLLRHEGGFVDHPNDPGGATNKGITMGTFRKYAQSLLGIEPTLANLKALSDEQAGIIYKERYWDRIYADYFDSQELANFTFDFYVNAGANAIKTLQRVLNDLSDSETPLAVDGGMGPKTLKVVNASPPARLFNAYKQARKGYYERIADRNPKLKVFLRGWMNRVNSFPDMPEEIV